MFRGPAPRKASQLEIIPRNGVCLSGMRLLLAYQKTKRQEVKLCKNGEEGLQTAPT